jgi:hypothetical protein
MGKKKKNEEVIPLGPELLKWFGSKHQEKKEK